MIEVARNPDCGKQHGLRRSHIRGDSGYRMMKAIARDKCSCNQCDWWKILNCGKTSLFNVASGSHQHVGNYSGVTVDAKEGYFEDQGYRFRLVDLPEPIPCRLIIRRNVRAQAYH